MTATQNTRRWGIALPIMILAVLALAPAAGAAGQDQLSGWERTSTAKGYDNGQAARAGQTSTVAEPGQGTSVEGLRGWEATTTATQRTARVVHAPSGPEVFPITSILLYLAGGLGALIVALGVARMVRPNRRPPRVA